MAKLIRNSFRLAINDLANQYALPVKSMTGFVLSKRVETHSDALNRRVVESLNLQPDSKVLELGYGRGGAIRYCWEHLRDGRGAIFGIERSGYMVEVAKKRFILETTETGRIQLDRCVDLRNLPYPSDFFSHAFHVDVFYFIHHDRLLDICRELFRVIQPGGSLICGMEFSRLRTLTKWGLLEESQWDPMRYLPLLEPAGFVDVKVEYEKDPKSGMDFQLLKAKKPDKDMLHDDPNAQMKLLEREIKKEMLTRELLRSGKRPSKEDLELINEIK